MIKIDVCEYCDRCPHFEPEVIERPKVNILASYSIRDMAEKRVAIPHGDTVVRCSDRNRCAAIYAYMEGLKNKEG